MTKTERKFLSIREYADIAGVSYSTIYRDIYEGKIRFKRFGSKTIRIPISELEVSPCQKN